MARTKKVEIVVALNKAALLLKNMPNIEQRAEKFAETVKRNLQKSILDALITKKESLEDLIDSKLDFSLNVDMNKGMTGVTREGAEQRFSEVIELRYHLELVSQELAIKQDIFNDYFGETLSPAPLKEEAPNE
jgi:hypothetical protein